MKMKVLKADEINDDDNDQDDKTENEVKFKNKRSNLEEYFNFFRKYKIQDVIRPKQVILIQINKEERGLKEH